MPASIRTAIPGRGTARAPIDETIAGVESVFETKKRLRTAAKLARATAVARHGLATGDRLAAHGLRFAGVANTAIVSGFSAIGDEISPLPLLVKLAEEGHPLCLPVVPGKGLPLLFRAWTPGDPTTPAVWGIGEPLSSSAVLQPDVLLVPLLAFDARGHRLGYGGGFYDRTIAALRALKPVITIGLALDEQRIDSVPHVGSDECLDWVLTPSGPIRCPESRDAPP
jgi:5-formyltetrahydrofolate cyclo-ligase